MIYSYNAIYLYSSIIFNRSVKSVQIWGTQLTVISVKPFQQIGDVELYEIGTSNTVLTGKWN